MTAQTRSTLAALFETGDTPDGTNFSDLIDSFLSLADTTAQSLTSNVTFPNITVTGVVSAATLVLASGGVKIDADTTACPSVATTFNVPSSAAGFALVQINGSTYGVPFFHKAGS